MPPLVQSCHLIAGASPAAQFILALAPGMSKSQITPYLPPEARIRVVEDATYDALGAADLAIVSSGTRRTEPRISAKAVRRMECMTSPKSEKEV